MLPAYVQLLWKVPFWLGLSAATVCAAITCVRPAVQPASYAVAFGWLTAMGWLVALLWCWTAYEYEFRDSNVAPVQLAATASRYRQVASAGLPLAAVLVGVLIGYGRMKFAVKLPPQLRSKQKLALQYYKQIMKNPPKAPTGKRNAD